MENVDIMSRGDRRSHDLIAIGFAWYLCRIHQIRRKVWFNSSIELISVTFDGNKLFIKQIIAVVAPAILRQDWQQNIVTPIILLSLESEQSCLMI